MLFVQLVYEFFKTGLFSFGGGYATLPFLYHISETYGWFTSKQLSDMIAVSTITPGPLGVNVATFSGFATAGLLGAFVATTAVVLPSYIIVIIVFNFLILGLSGNTGVAAYGILANIALVLVSIFTGIGQGIQPVVSRYAGETGRHQRNRLRRYALCASLLLALLAYGLISIFAVPIAELFNRDHTPILTSIASEGMRIYFISLFFSGINIVAAAFLSSADRPKEAFAVSILRGFVLIIPTAWLLSALLGLIGIWMAVPVTEALVCILSIIFIFRK